jgi:mRNA interferase MazF
MEGPLNGNEGPLNGDVVTVLYPYTDLSGVKRRPAVVIAQLNEDEYLVCQITSQPTLFPHGVRLLDEHFKYGTLNHLSQIRCDRLISVHRTIITKTIGPSSFIIF